MEVDNDSDKNSDDVYLPGQTIGADEELVCDDSAYIMYHQAQTESPCLSFDILTDKFGDQRETYPMCMYIVAGTQAEQSSTNSVIVMRMRNIHRNKESKEKKDENSDDDDDESEDESDDEDDKDPQLDAATISHSGAVNRIRSTNIGEISLAASWSDTGKVHIWDLKQPIDAINDSQKLFLYNKNNVSSSATPVFSFPGHQVEGFAIDWCTTTVGRLATGDCNKNIHVWNPQEGGSWAINQTPYVGHTNSVEDIQWSTTEANVFASCSVDKSIRIWDVRAKPNKACMLTADNAHDSDINVIHWNPMEPLLVSGGDDGHIKVWDLRRFQEGQPLAVLKHHTSAITSVEWHHTDSSVLAASGSDDQLTIWDLAVEPDDVGAVGDKVEALPPQLLFIHQGQKDIKELHWHHQCPGVIISTAFTGFNVFRTISV